LEGGGGVVAPLPVMLAGSSREREEGRDGGGEQRSRQVSSVSWPATPSVCAQGRVVVCVVLSVTDALAEFCRHFKCSDTGANVTGNISRGCGQ
jgi:hypothetical protein